jgi:membrane protease YdiL (CAAX protease family)
VNDEEAIPHPRAWDPTIVVLLYTAVALIIAEYLFIPPHFREFFPAVEHPLGTFLWWVGGLLVVWVAVPLWLARRVGFGVHDLGLGLGALRSKLWIYGALYLLVFVPVLLASREDAFLATYPLIRVREPASWTWGVLLWYWLIYAVQFACVEFFFRGFLIFTLRPRMGYVAIAVMVVPYTMIHFHKPMPEALGAVVAGLVLGWLAFRTESIWGGVALHVAVALTMDALAMAHGGGVRWPM